MNFWNYEEHFIFKILIIRVISISILLCTQFDVIIFITLSIIGVRSIVPLFVNGIDKVTFTILLFVIVFVLYWLNCDVYNRIMNHC